MYDKQRRVPILVGTVWTVVRVKSAIVLMAGEEMIAVQVRMVIFDDLCMLY